MTFKEKHVDQELMMREIKRSMASLENKIFFSFVQRGVRDEREGEKKGMACAIEKKNSC